ncbi:MAG: two-component system, OmpR family, sensor kinase [Pseudonocardiales bacterium]|nr:two-component system, OmpR family, sensor kinase [Pseudonocardiales bacterium]
MSRQLGLRAALAARLQRVTLRRRLIAILLALLLVSCAVVAAVTGLLLHAYLQNKLDQQLATAGTRYSIALEHAGDRDLDDAQFASVLGQPSGTLGARILSGQVTAIGIIGGGTEHPVPSAGDRSAIAALSASSGARTVQLPQLGDYRVVVTPGRDGDLLVTGLPEHGVDETTQRLVLVELGVFAGAILLTGVAGAISVRRSLRPLEQVAHMARRVSDLPLGSGAVSLPERLPNPAPETEVGQVADAVNHMLSHVEAALAERHSSEERLRTFIADASHELRTPVAVIRSHADYAQRTNDSLPPETDQALERIGAEAARMGRLVDDLLLLARLDAGQELLHEDVDLTRIVLDTVADAQLTGPEHRWELDLPEHAVTVRGDAHRLHQALANLLTNARTHTPPGTVVSVALGEHTTTGEIEIRVRDNGPGISPEVAPHVLKRFVRGDNARSKTSSSAGLGLSIVAAIVAAHGGTFGLASEPGRTDFWIRLPA